MQNCCSSSSCSSHLPPFLPPHHTPTTIPTKPINITTRRRALLSLLLPLPILPTANALLAEQPLDLYVDRRDGFALLRPATWVKVEKPGAAVLFEDTVAKTNNIGVVVNPVKLSSLRNFGTPEFVAEKLISVERRKESTKDASVIKSVERLGHGGLPIYEFEYTVDSTRGGMKRIFSAAFVMSKKLYLLNIVHSDRPENPLDNSTRMILEQVLHSFDAAM